MTGIWAVIQWPDGRVTIVQVARFQSYTQKIAIREGHPDGYLLELAPHDCDVRFVSTDEAMMWMRSEARKVWGEEGE